MLRKLLVRYPAFGHALYRKYWFASIGSVGATQLVALGQGWLVFELSGSALELGLLGAATALPNIIVSLLGGVLADRFDKRLILLITSAATGAMFVLLAILDATGTVAVWHVLSIAAIVAAISGIEWPTRQSFFPYLIDREALLSAVAMNSFLWQSTRMIIPAAGGLLIALTDTWCVFALAAGGYAAMFFVMYGIKVSIPPGASGSALQQAAEGFRFIAGNQLFASLMVLSYGGMLFGSAYLQLMPAFAGLLGAGETGYGVLLSATGLGSVIGTLLIGGLSRQERQGWMLLGGALASGICLFVFAAGVAGGFYGVALVSAMLVSVTASIFMVTAMTVMQLEVPEQLRGRVMGIHSISYSLMPLGGLLMGAVAHRSSEVTALLLSASAFIVVTLAVAIARPAVRRIDASFARPAKLLGPVEM